MTWALIWGPNGTQKASIGENITDSNMATALAEFIGQNTPKALTDNPVVSATLSPLSDAIQYYEAQTGKVFKVNLNTRRTETISDKRLAGFVRTFWAPDGQQVVSVFEERDGLVLRYYNYATSQTTVIGKSAVSAAFSPDGRSLAFLDTGDSSLALIIGQPDGTESRKIMVTRSGNGIIEWPQKDHLSLLTQRLDSAGRDLSLIGLNGSLQILLSNRENLEYAWSPNGQKLLFSYFVTGKGVQLWYLDTTVGVPVSLNVPTSAAKCAWQPGEQGVVCGIPSSDALTNDVPAAKTATLDSISRIDLVSGAQNQIYNPQKGVLLGVGESLISSSGTYFVFRNLFDQRLYSLPLN